MEMCSGLFTAWCGSKEWRKNRRSLRNGQRIRFCSMCWQRVSGRLKISYFTITEHNKVDNGGKKCYNIKKLGERWF